MAIREIYTSAVRANLQNLFANWEPSRPVKIGDYGLLDGAWFEPLGSIDQFKVPFETEDAAERTTFTFTSTKDVEVKLTARGKAPNAKAGLELGFGSSDAVYVHAAGCQYTGIKERRLLGDALRDKSAFDRRWVVVTDIVQAERSIIAVSAGAGAKLTFEAEASVPQIDLADAALALTATSASAIGYQVNAKRGLTPLIGLCGFRAQFLGPNVFRSMSEGAAPVADLSDDVFSQL